MLAKIKTKVVVFLGDEPVRTKIVVDSRIIERVKRFNYKTLHFGCKTFYGFDRVSANKINEFGYIGRIINQNFKLKTRN